MLCILLVTFFLIYVASASRQTDEHSFKEIGGMAGQSLLSFSSKHKLFQQDTSLIKADFNTTYSMTVNSSLELIFEYNYKEVSNMVRRIASQYKIRVE